MDNILQEWQQLVKNIDADLIPEIMYDVEKYMDVNKKLLDVTVLLRVVLKKITGKLNERYHKLYLLAVTLECSIYGACDKEYLKILQTKADSLSGPERLGIEIMKTVMSVNEIEDVLQIFTGIKNDDSISRNLKGTFADALGVRLFYVGRVKEAEELYDFVLEADTEEEVIEETKEDTELEESTGNTYNYNAQGEAVTSDGKSVKMSYDSNLFVSLEVVDGSIWE